MLQYSCSLFVHTLAGRDQKLIFLVSSSVPLVLPFGSCTLHGYPERKVSGKHRWKYDPISDTHVSLIGLPQLYC